MDKSNSVSEGGVEYMSNGKRGRAVSEKYLNLNGLTHLLTRLVAFVKDYASPKTHNHDNVYSKLSHTHTTAQVTGLDAALAGKADKAHNHDAANITSGTVSEARLPVVPISKGGTGRTTIAGVIQALFPTPKHEPPFSNDTFIPFFGASFENGGFTRLSSLGKALGIEFPVPVAKGGTGKTNSKDAANFLVSSLGSGTASPSDQHLILTEDIDPVHKGEFVKRPLSSLWAYIKQKCDGLYLNKEHDAKRALGVKDAGDGRTITINYSGPSAPNAPYFAVWENSILKSIRVGDVAKAAGALTPSGGTITGLLKTQGGTTVHKAEGERGKAGYVNIAEISINNVQYQNTVIQFDIVRRGIETPNSLYIKFQNSATTDPALDSFKYDGYYEPSAFYLHKSSAGIWQLYIKKTETFDSVAIVDYKTNFDYMAHKLTYKDQLVTTVPEGAIEAKYIGLPAASASDNGKFLRVVNGTPTWDTVPSAENMAF